MEYIINTFYLLVCGALVMWMAAGFTMLEAGMVRAKNTTEILTKNLCLYAIACLTYLLWGYGLMYQGNVAGAWIPNWFGGVGQEAGDAGHALGADFFFQAVFVATTMSIVSGAVAERMKLSSFLLFCLVLTGLLYPVSGFWTWGGGALAELGFVDFAGSAIVHMAGASAALAGVLLLGPRRGKYDREGRIYPIPGSNMPLAALGTLILWMGWLGFNGGSQLSLASKEDASAVASIFVNTNSAAAAGVLAALAFCKWRWGKADLTMILNGALGGLVAITADPLSPSLLGAAAIGALAGALVVPTIAFMDRLRIDDPVGAISVHGVCGALGILLVPLSNDEASLRVQILGMLAICGWVFISSLATWWALKKSFGIRVSGEDELAGMDKADCGIDAYPEFVTLKRG